MKRRQLVAHGRNGSGGASAAAASRRSFPGAVVAGTAAAAASAASSPAATAAAAAASSPPTSTAAAAAGSTATQQHIWTEEDDALIMELAAKELGRRTGSTKVRNNFWSSVQARHFPHLTCRRVSRRYADLREAAGLRRKRGTAACKSSGSNSGVDRVTSAKGSEAMGTLPWTERDDDLIWAAAEKELKKTGSDKVRAKFWPHIQKKHFPDRTFKQVSRRYRKLNQRKRKTGRFAPDAASSRSSGGGAMEIDRDASEDDDTDDEEKEYEKEEDNQNVCGMCRGSLTEPPRVDARPMACPSAVGTASPPVGTLSHKQKAQVHAPCCPAADSGVCVVVCANAATTMFTLSPEKKTRTGKRKKQQRLDTPRQKQACPHPRYHLACSAIPVGSRLYRDAVTDHYATMCGGRCRASASGAGLKIRRATSPEREGSMQPHEQGQEQQQQQQQQPQTQFDAEQVLRGYLCPYCDVEGTSHYLIEYFEAYRKSKTRFCHDEEAVDKVCPASSQGREFVEYVLRSASGVSKHGMNAGGGGGRNGAKLSALSPCKTMGMTTPKKTAGTAVSTMGSNEKKSEVQLHHIEKIFAGVAHGDDIGSVCGTGNEFDPSVLVGQPIRLFNPIEDAYHIGRIVDWRDVPLSDGDDTCNHHDNETTKVPPSEKKSTQEGNIEEIVPRAKRGRPRKHPISSGGSSASMAIAMESTSEKVASAAKDKPITSTAAGGSEAEDGIIDNRIGKTQYLVRFRSGVDGRKVPVHQWIFLEEHALSVGLCVVWADPSRKGLLNLSKAETGTGIADGEQNEHNGEAKLRQRTWYRPAQIVVRTALEMLPVKDLNSAKDDDKQTTSALAYFFGKDFRYAVLPLGTAKECARNSDDMRVQLDNKSASFVAADFTYPPSAIHAHLREAPYNDDDKLATSITMATMEKEEQRRLRAYAKLPIM